jgi:acyl carrier protein
VTTPQEILQRVQRVVESVFGDVGVVLQPSTTAAEVDGWDSVSNIEVLVALEREFGIRFHTGEMAGLENIGQLVERIRSRLPS